MCVDFYLSMHVCWCMCILVYVYMWVYTYVMRVCCRVYTCTRICLCEFICLVACYSVSDSFGKIRTVVGDPDPIRICARCGPDTQVIRRLIHGMICKSVPVRTAKTRQRFSSKTASFHVSVCSHVFLYLLLSVVFMYLFVSFHVII